jgi:tripartite-type tricarboxylate transporter receptor subunit TctC
MLVTRRAALAGAALILAHPAFAQQEVFPSRPVRLVVPFPPGGSTDVVGRLVAQGLQERLGQPVVVENRAGNAGIIGSNAVKLSAPDGYTLVMSNIGSQGIAPIVYPSVPYDTMRDFAHIGLMGTYYNVLLVNPAFPARTLSEFLAEARRRPGAINFATSGNGSSNHLLGELLKLEAGIDIVHVPYRGAGPALTATMGGEVPAMFDSIPSASAQIRAATLRPLAVSAPRRLPYLSEVPTFTELGFPRLVASNWFGLSAPAGTPASVIGRLSQALNDALGTPALSARLAEIGFDVVSMDPPEFTRFVSSQLAFWSDIVHRAGVTAN